MGCLRVALQALSFSFRISDFILLAVFCASFYVFGKNNHKKIFFTALFLVLSWNICERGWYEDDMKLYFKLFFGIGFCLFILFVLMEKVTQILSRNEKSEKVWLISGAHNAEGFSNALSDMRGWMFIDNEYYQNLSSVKTKLFIRSLQISILMLVFVLLVIFVFNLKKFDPEKLVLSVPTFLVVFSYFANQHWNQWKYTADLYNSIDVEKSNYRNKRLCLVIDLIVLDLWSNRAFATFFEETLKEELGVHEKRISSQVVLDLLSKRQADLVDRKSQVCGDMSHI